ncbi:conserved hypothetical protein [Treponema primitia ZAS-2]|uniref:Uncharacterized protein n=1 Tax=Treponema primitia (strain ATCC BAA-887 / DSM 12427 / ZAS-2) TaxID=545694 RepID=F5YKA6_TREPZ|nr:DUF5685 family protein [Treponema primitia]AEF86738.1 conserved hypothetical protein [Treponema primitia ZAS-2]
MFGTVRANRKALSPEERKRYDGAYCGLCCELGARAGALGRSCLSYDMAFLSMLLSSVYKLDEKQKNCVCAFRPIPHPCIANEALSYCADMNIILSYYQALDDWKDDRKRSAKQKSDALAAYLPTLSEKWPGQCLTIKEKLKDLSAIEKANELNPDLPMNCFGELLGEIFLWAPGGAACSADSGEYAAPLKAMGAALGRFIYLLDACNDLRRDIKKQRYNPLVVQRREEFTPLLTMMMAECTAACDKLPINRDSGILRNVLYSGVWQSYRHPSGKKKAEA